MRIAKRHTCTGHRASVYALTAGLEPGTFLSAAGDGWVVRWRWDDPENGHLLAAVENQVFALASNTQTDTVAAGNMNGGLHFIRPNHPEDARNIQHHQKGVFGLLFLNDELLSVGGDGVLTRWRLMPARSVESLQLSAYALRCLDYSPSRAELAVGSTDHHIYLLDARTLAVRNVVREAHSNSVFSVRYAPDGRFLLSGGRDAMLRVWALAEGPKLMSEQPAHWFTINDIVFSPDGALFATASRDKTIKIWDAADRRLLKVVDTLRFGGHINSVNALLWIPEGLVSAGDDRSLMLWDVHL